MLIFVIFVTIPRITKFSIHQIFHPRIFSRLLTSFAYRASGVTKFKTTKINSEDPRQLFTKICTSENYPLYGMYCCVLPHIHHVLLCTTPYTPCTAVYYPIYTMYCCVLPHIHHVLLCTTPYTLCTAVYYPIYTMYCCVLPHIHHVLLCTTPYTLCTAVYYTPYTPCTAVYYPIYTMYCCVLPHIHHVLLCTAPYTLCTAVYYCIYYRRTGFKCEHAIIANCDFSSSTQLLECNV